MKGFPSRPLLVTASRVMTLLVMLLLMGCGGGGGTTTSSGGVPGATTGGGTGDGGGTASGPVGYITVTFPGPSAPDTLVPVRGDSLATFAGSRDHFRLVVKQVGTMVYVDEENNPYTVTVEFRRYVADGAIPGSLTMAVSPGDGYTAEILTYQQIGSINNMLEYAKSTPFSVASGVDTPVSMTLTPVSESVTMTTPDNVVSISGSSYNVAISKVVPLRSQYYLSQFESVALWPTITDFVVGYGSAGAVQRTSASVTFPVPTAVAQSNIYLQGQFFIDDSLLSDAERLPATPPTWSNWRINCPDPAYTDNVKSTLLLPGTVSIILGTPPVGTTPTATTSAASSPNSTDAMLSGTVNPTGSATTAWFEWGTSQTLSTYNATAPQNIGSGTTGVPVNFPMTGLNAGTIYYYRVVLNNSGGTVRGNIASFMTLTTWVKTFGGIGYDSAEDIRQTSDGGYIIAGYTNSFIGAGARDFYLIKADAFGTALWTKTYHPGATNGDSLAFSVQQTSDGGYVIAGNGSSSPDNIEIYLIKTDASGNAVWTKTFGGSGIDWLSAVQQTSDGGYILAGTTDSFGAGDNAAYLIKTDASGNAVWTKTFGGSANYSADAVQQTSDGGYIIAGSTDSFGAGNNDVYLIKADASGNAVWTKTFGGTGLEMAFAVQQISGGGYIIAGRTTSFGAGNYDVYLIKTDASGNAVWTKTFGGTNYDVGRSVRQTSDGGYIIGGITRSFGAGGRDVYLIKTDASGNADWMRTFGGTGDEWGTIVRQTLDGGYIIAGRTPSFGAGGDDVYLIKTDANGN